MLVSCQHEKLISFDRRALNAEIARLRVKNVEGIRHSVFIYSEFLGGMWDVFHSSFF